MMERNALILRSKAEVLDRRRNDLSRDIAKMEQTLADLSAKYEQRLSAKRAEGALGFSHAPSVKELTKNRELRREAFRQAFAIGLGFSLMLGLLAVFA